MLQCLDVEESRELREFLQTSGYNTKALIATFGHTDVPQVHLMKLFMVGVAMEPDCLNILFRWFWIGGGVEAAVVRRFIPERILELFSKSGILAAEEDQLVSNVRISPFMEFFILSDHAVARSGAQRADTVLWPNPTSMLAHHLALQSPVDHMLDLGTGNGILAVAAAPHSNTVIATDLNPRAAEFCRYNAALNGISNIEYREGNSFEPVRGEKFDLILANPPFFVTPEVRRVYSDNGMELDGFCRTLIQQAPGHLKEGGYCQMLLEWVELKGQPWRERLGEWFAGLGCDVWLMVDYMRSALDYSLIRVQEDRDEAAGSGAQAALTSKWQKYFEDRQVEAVYGGILMMRLREGKNWMRVEELTAMPSRPFGDFMRRVFESRDYLEKHSDEEMLESRPLLPASARLYKQFVISPEGWKLASVDLQLNEGLSNNLSVQPQVADFVGLCDGKRTLGEIADMTAAAVKVDPAVVRRESCKIIRQVAERGVLLL